MASDLPRQLKNWKPITTSEKLALVLLQKLKSSGYKKSYIVGGYVRDKLLGLAKPGSIDIATEATPQQVQRALKNFRVLPTGLKHGTVTVHRGHDDIEITTFRREGKYTDYRRPDTVHYIRDTKADSGRRDFTINALYFDTLNGELLDYHQGVRDLAARKLRFIGSPKKRIAEDPLRLMRALRFAATLDFR